MFFGMSGIGSVIEAAELGEILEKLPAGLQQPLGEGGRLTSGGEGQRVRFGRALVRRDVKLAILDEPFRGLDRPRRRELMVRAREIWRQQTLMCVTHDIEETLDFERVLVVENGELVEDGHPLELAQQESVYASLLAAERSGPVTSGVELHLARKYVGLHQPEQVLTHLAEARRISWYEGDPAETKTIEGIIAQFKAQLP